MVECLYWCSCELAAVCRYVCLISFSRQSVELIEVRLIALAWSGVSIPLPLVLNSSKQNLAMTEGFQTISDLMRLFHIRETLYQSRARREYIAATVHLYTAMFKYQAQMIVYLSSNALVRGISGTFEQIDWKASRGGEFLQRAL